MENPKISVIVPVYNTDKYLHKCLDSILAQTFTDFEVLLINDGSTDNSGDICDEYAELDSRVRVFHKENGGVSSARNLGLKNLSGDYSIHVDSDDWIDSHMLEEMHNIAIEKNCDIVWCDYYRNIEDTDVLIKQDYGVSSSSCVDALILQRMHGSLCNKLIRSSLIAKNKLMFINRVDLWEDLLFTIKCFMYAQSVCYLPKAFYHYMHRENSILTSSYSIDKTLMQKKVVDNLSLFFYADKSRERLLDTMSAYVKLPLLRYPGIYRDIWIKIKPNTVKEIWRTKLSKRHKILFVLYQKEMYNLLRVYNKLTVYASKK